jgi:fatty acid desaturase
MPLAIRCRMLERHRDLIIHFVRIAGSAGLYAAAMAGDLLSIAVPAAGATFFAVFFLAHDLVHGSLGLPPRVRRQVRAAAAQLLLISGEVMRLSHLRHHARPFAPDDLEGVAVRLGLTRTMRALPYLFIVLRIAVFGGAGPASRRRQLLEHALNAGGLAVGLLVPALRPYVVVALLAQLLVPIWAGYVPHRAPAWLLRCARRLAATGSPLAIGLAYHDLHHDAADIPSGRLGDQRCERFARARERSA